VEASSRSRNQLEKVGQHCQLTGQAVWPLGVDVSGTWQYSHSLPSILLAQSQLLLLHVTAAHHSNVAALPW
jgi:hypothetical protein